MRPRISISSVDYVPPTQNSSDRLQRHVAIEQRNYQRQQEYNDRINAEIAAATASTSRAQRNQQQNNGGLGGFLKMYGCMFGLQMFGGMLMPMMDGMMI